MMAHPFTAHFVRRTFRPYAAPDNYNLAGVLQSYSSPETDPIEPKKYEEKSNVILGASGFRDRTTGEAHGSTQSSTHFVNNYYNTDWATRARTADRQPARSQDGGAPNGLVVVVSAHHTVVGFSG